MISHWTDMLRTHWGIDARLTRLDGEYDLNLLAEAPDGTGHVLKAMRPGCPDWLVDLQVAAMTHVGRADPGLPIPRVATALSGAKWLTLPDQDGQDRLVWVITRLEGRCYARSRTRTLPLIRAIGDLLGRNARALSDFAHPGLNRDFKWDLLRAGWIAPHLDDMTDTARGSLLAGCLADFEALKPALLALPRQAIHNDANDYNILVPDAPGANRVTGLIDFGDMCTGPRICDLAIAAAYIVLDHPQPDRALQALVAGYHAACPLTGDEVDLLWPLIRMRLAVSVVNSGLMAADKPNDPYVVISQAPAWRFLEGFPKAPDLLTARLRAACDLPVGDGAGRVMDWLVGARGSFAPVLGADLADAPMQALSVEASTCPQDPFDMTRAEAAGLDAATAPDADIWLGYYLEPRLIYTAPAFRLGPWKASNRRTVHLGVDIFAAAGTAVQAPLEGTVAAIENRTGNLDYGGVIVLRHETPQGDSFHTLYGHLDPDCLTRLKPGDRVGQGEAFCHLGDVDRNGGWAPHLHMQLALTIEGIGDDWPGVCDPDDIALWQAVCPNPAALLNLPDDKVRHRPTDRAAVLADRRAHFGGNLSLTYAEPVMLLRGWRHHLFDEWGRPYLDAYNNVPHVGHAHPRIQAIAADQLRRINSNTRYLHPAQTAFAEALLARLPDHLQVCFFVNSGSEENELALRLARAHTGARGIVTPDHVYHGNTTGAVAISAYKFNKPNGVGKADWVELVEVADDYPTMRDTSPLFQPIRFGAIHAPNRIVMAPLTRTRANHQDAVHALQAEYYAQRASAGLIVSEATQISPQGKGYAGAPGIHTQPQTDGWRGVTRAVHDAGGRIVLQLWHVGRVSHPSLQPGGALPVAPSAIGFEGHAHTYDGPQPFVVPRALETSEIPGIIVADYARAAANAKTAGFDKVEIHAANSYLLDEFLRDGTNRRTDAYGGSVENRARLTLEVTDAITAVWGADRVGIRLSPSLTINGMSDSDPAAAFGHVATELGRRKLAYLHVVEPKDPRGDPMDRIVDPIILRRAFGGPYIGNSGYTADRALDALAEDRLDAVSFGRLFIANPDLPRRLRDGLPMTPLNAARLYGGGADGYTDYPALAADDVT